MSYWNSNTCNYKNNFNKPSVSHNKTHKGNFKKICNNCINSEKINSDENKKEIIICNKPICPDIIDIYMDKYDIYIPKIKVNDKDCKDEFHINEECNKDTNDDDYINKECCKYKDDECYKENIDMKKLNDFIKVLSNKIIGVK